MKIAILMGLLVGFCVFAEEKVTVKISGMSCKSCVKSVKSSTCTLDGVKSCEVNVGEAVYVYTTAFDEKKLKEAIESNGKYKVTEVHVSEVKIENTTEQK